MMIEDKIPDDRSGLIVEPAHVEVIFTEGRGSVLSVQMPPIEDIAEMDKLKIAQFSIGEVASRDLAMSESSFDVELAEQLKKQAVHGYSAVFNNRLANLAQLAGDRELEEKFLRKAIELSGEGFFFDRLGENLIMRERFADAEKLFAERDLEKDLHANLRLAFFHVKRSDFDAASKVLNRAVAMQSPPLGISWGSNKSNLKFGLSWRERYLKLAHSMKQFQLCADRGASSIRQKFGITSVSLTIAEGRQLLRKHWKLSRMRQLTNGMRMKGSLRSRCATSAQCWQFKGRMIVLSPRPRRPFKIISWHASLCKILRSQTYSSSVY
jgi:hypothetical protein